MTNAFRTQLRVELARQNITYLELARRIGRPVSTLSSWLRGVSPPPAHLVRNIEAALGLEPEALGADVGDDH